jgi:hypothetical protein
MAVDDKGRLWACGDGSYGQLGLGDTAHRLVPTRVNPQHFARAPISVVAAGNFHSAVVTTGGALYTWGQGETRWCESELPGQAASGPGSLGHAGPSWHQREFVSTKESLYPVDAYTQFWMPTSDAYVSSRVLPIRRPD